MNIKKTRALKAVILRHLDMASSAFLSESLAIDPLYMGCLYEKAVTGQALGEWKKVMRTEAHNYLELALDYMKAGFAEDALNILSFCQDSQKAMASMEKACALDAAYPRLWMEYDQLAAKMNLTNEKRLSVMESHPETTAGRDDL